MNLIHRNDQTAEVFCTHIVPLMLIVSVILIVIVLVRIQLWWVGVVTQCEAHQWGKEELFALTNIPLCSIDLHYQLHRDVSNYYRVSRSFHCKHWCTRKPCSVIVRFIFLRNTNTTIRYFQRLFAESYFLFSESFRKRTFHWTKTTHCSSSNTCEDSRMSNFRLNIVTLLPMETHNLSFIFILKRWWLLM